jgi:WD40 repeat protein
VASSPDGNLIAEAADGDYMVRLWNTSALDKGPMLLSGHTSSVNSVAFSPDGKTLLTGGDDESAQLWDTATGKNQGVINDKSFVRAVAFSPDGKTLATGDSDGAVRVWDVATEKMLAELTGHASVVTSVSFTSDGKHIISSSQDGSVRVWTLQ